MRFLQTTPDFQGPPVGLSMEDTFLEIWHQINFKEKQDLAEAVKAAWRYRN